MVVQTVGLHAGLHAGLQTIPSFRRGRRSFTKGGLLPLPKGKGGISLNVGVFSLSVFYFGVFGLFFSKKKEI